MRQKRIAPVPSTSCTPARCGARAAALAIRGEIGSGAAPFGRGARSRSNSAGRPQPEGRRRSILAMPDADHTFTAEETVPAEIPRKRGLRAVGWVIWEAFYW